MLYNTGHRFTNIIQPPSQEDIYNCPLYFEMSYDQIKNVGAPQFLISLLDQFPFDGRKNFIQVRPQDFRTGNPYNLDGTHWHTDYSARLINEDGSKKKVYAKDHNEFHIMTISWGAGCRTEFAKTPMELPNNLDYKDTKEKWEIWNNMVVERLKEPFESAIAPNDQMSEYTTRDLHRANRVIHSKGLRLLIIATDSDNIDGNIRILPSIKEMDNGAIISDYER